MRVCGETHIIFSINNISTLMMLCHHVEPSPLPDSDFF